MYCLEKNFTFGSYRQRIESWLSCYYFSRLYMQKTSVKLGDIAVYYEECDEFWSDSWSLNVDSKQGLDFLGFVNEYFKEPKEKPKSYYERTETLVKFLCTKSHDNVRLTKSTYMYTNRIIFNTICDLQNQATKLYQYFIKKASNDNLRWLMYAMFLYETYFRLNKGEINIYNEDPLNFYKYAEGRVLIFNENSINSKS